MLLPDDSGVMIRPSQVDVIAMGIAMSMAQKSPEAEFDQSLAYPKYSQEASYPPVI